MVDFSQLLSPKERSLIRAVRTEMERLYNLPDRWLAEALLRMARQVRSDFPEKLSDPSGATYEPNLVWHIVPEIAKRLGAKRLELNEANDPQIVCLDGAGLRKCAGVYLKNQALARWDIRKMKDTGSTSSVPSAARILGHTVSNGNPIAIALDRLHPALDRDDWIASDILNISSLRGFEPTPYWSPQLQNYSVTPSIKDKENGVEENNEQPLKI